MPSHKGMEQALIWLKSKMAEKDTLDAVNAELTYNVIMDIQSKREAIGGLYHLTKVQNKRLLEKQGVFEFGEGREEKYNRPAERSDDF